jgi:alcohol dehydrogenase (cytochrome c)
MTYGKLAWAGTAAAALAAGALLLAGAAQPARDGAYTREQAASGQFVYIEHCLKCHGAQLEGGAGPPLQGPQFGRSLATGKMTAPALYTFVHGAMPLDAPGSLSDAQYLDVLAYLFSKNGYAPGDSALTKQTLARVQLLPYPALAPAPTPATTAAPSNAGTVRSDAAVALDDARMRSADRDAKDWRLPGRVYANWRYSPLTQITPGNVASLEPVTVVHTGMFAGFETTPLVVDGIMYVTTPVVDDYMKIMALDAATGATIWSTSHPVGPHKTCCGPNNRGAALGYGSLYVGTLDAKLVAFDARTGAKQWETQVADPSVGYSESMAPQVFGGTVVIGSAGGEWALRGFVAGYDARTGKQRWRWYATDPKTFAGDSWKTGGGTVWTTPAIDPERNLVIFSTANPNPDLEGSTRAGDNLYTDCIVALDVRTGKLRWYYQEVKHDLWDYDAASNVVLLDVRKNGQTIPAAAQAGKVGWLFVVDRRNGKLIRRSDAFVAQNAHMFAEKRVLPGANGGSEWSPPAYSPQTHDVYTLGINQLMDFTTQRGTDHPGFMHTGSVFTNVKKPTVQTGTFSAIDVDTGHIAWQYHSAQPMIGGALATAGGLVFTGEGDGTFVAFDAKTGKKLWTHSFDGGVNAPPISYEVGGTQYVAVAAGGNFQLDFKRSDEIGIFRVKR